MRTTSINVNALKDNYSPLSITRNTNFNPDQVSSTAQTFTSTSPDFRPISRTTCSLTSVTIFDACHIKENIND